ncbi:outer membrane beta-barrel protein [Ferruginibacter sp. SUN106]|uniref:outer membrane beta-barrel protein n=1 Tax=Ferruginibacter sp. SUN106 TaxID=2978348 RepID=UPI003D367C09
MERKFYTDNFEQLLKEKSDEFRMYPSKRVWHSIYNDLHPGRKWPSVAVSMILIIALLLTGYWNNNSASKTLASTSSPKNNITAFTGNTKNNANTVSQLNTVVNTEVSSANNTAAKNAPENNSAVTPAVNSGLASNSITIKHGSTFKVHSNNPLSTIAADNNDVALQGKNNADVKAGNAIKIQKATAGIAATGNNDQQLNAVTPNAIANTNSKTGISSLQQNGTKATVSATISGINSSAAKMAATEVTAFADPLQTDEKINHAESNDETVNPVNTFINNNSSKTVIAANENNSNEKNSTDKKEIKEDNTLKSKSDVAKKTTLTEDKAWMEDYAFHNKSRRKKWQDRTAFEFYFTPGVVYRTITNDPKYNIPAATPSFAATTVADASSSVNQNPGAGFEAGVSINYSLAKNIRVKAGLQANYTSYGINANETNHPVLTTLLLLDPNSGYPYMHPAVSTLSNLPGAQHAKTHNQTYQVSIPIGFALKLAGNSKLEWYAGATIQPSFVIGGKAFLISADRKNYVADPSLIRKWNLNSGFETYINYKMDGFTFQAGPQFRYQLLSTYYNKYTVKENLYNVGLKIGILKNF